ncbi:MAG: hypothetical protein JKY37_20320, partial [Nannocystaceae bacterium]|nr:hypothetical protein [Nannocystaceae bacterium]
MLPPLIVLSLAAAIAVPTARAQGVQPSAQEAGSSEAKPGTIVVGPAAKGTAVIIDAAGAITAHLTLIPGRVVTVGVPPGKYTIESDGRQIANLEVGAGETIVLASPPSLAAPVPEPIAASKKVTAKPTAHGPSTASKPATAAKTVSAKTIRAKAILAPLASAVLPGAGQIITKRPGRGMAFFTGAVAMTVGAALLWKSGNPTEGAPRDNEGDSGAVEVVRLGGVAALTGAAALLYLGQILDAYGGAVGKLGKSVRPAKDHLMALEFQRSSTVGFAPGQPEYRLLSDYSLAVMGQVAPRVTVGASDLSIKLEPERSGVVVQGGVRSAYRFYDRRRVWLSAGGGIAVQGT